MDTASWWMLCGASAFVGYLIGYARGARRTSAKVAAAATQALNALSARMNAVFDEQQQALQALETLLDAKRPPR